MKLLRGLRVWYDGSLRAIRLLESLKEESGRKRGIRKMALLLLRIRRSLVEYCEL